MRIEYLIDGYNLLRARSEGQRRSGPGNLEKERQSLLAWINGGIDSDVDTTVVFDSSARRRLDETAVDHIRVLFAGGYENADELIREICRKHSHPKQLVVVSDDREVAAAAKRRGAKSIGCDAFEKLVEQGAPKPAADQEKPSSMTEPERKQWLEIFGDASRTADADLEAFNRDMRSADDDEP